ncbi:vWA domain-containing protein [Microbacterium ulmi]|uniref:VWA domain-containing protein n=1 Tax=Microbacterium ulmi TaxID=179095 RepID=A0A7Y2LX01_9MICO|nr:vWA domain-containing protein [Microbacterium ulmi]NII71077.1 hypothetical protein [Microbacterium ulmi]NNH02384.1 VWA domain-containing protein [Microbacterium ulmi]
MSLACALALVAAIVSAPVAAPPSRAVIGAPDPGAAILHVRVADYRTAGSVIAPLAGVTLGLFVDEPSATIDSNSGFAVPDAAHPLFFTCVSDADGDCVFQVPIRAGSAVAGADQVAPFANNTDPSRGVPQGTRLYVASLAAPAGYFANPFWQTGPLSPSTADPLIELRHVWQSPPLVADRSYISGTDWITDPGLQTAPAHANPNYTRRIASSGVVVFSRANVALPDRCGLNIALVVDVSSSVNGSQGQLVTAMNQFVDALRGTPSQIALVTFGTDSPGNGFGSNTPLMSVATTAEARAFRNLYDDDAAPPGSNRDWNDPTFSWPTNYTNWDRGFAATAAMNGDAATGDTHLDMVVFLTDGNPTVYGANPLTGGTPTDRSSGYTRFRELSNGLASANLVKLQDTRVLAVGVGAGINSPQARDNLRTVSGEVRFDGANIGVADYLQTVNYAEAGAALRNLVLDACAPSLSVIKRIVPDGGTVADAYLPGEAWTFDATTPDPEVDIDGTPADTSHGSGGVSFPIAFDPAAPPGFTGQIRVEEGVGSLPQSAYTPLPAETACVERSTGVDVPVDVVPDPAEPDTAFSVQIGLQQMVTCTVFNQAPPTVQPASVAVHKLWRIVSAIGVEMAPDGRQPFGLSATAALTGPGTGQFTPEQWSVERTGYNANPAAPIASRTVSIDETTTIDPLLPLCELTEDPLIRAGAPDPDVGLDEYDPLDPTTAHPLSPGLNEWTILNEVTCTSQLTLRKDVTNGPLDTPEGEDLWGLVADSPFNDPPWNVGVSGTTGVTAEVIPGALYQLAETPDLSEHFTQHYLQHDIRTQPLLYPQSSGSWNCRPQSDPIGDPSVGAEGAVIVPLGQHYECTAQNTTALLTVAKTVLPSGDPLAFTFRAQFIPPPIIPDPLVHDFQAGAAQSLVPGQRYQLTELDSPGYELVSMTCESAGEPFDPADFTLLFGAEAHCAAVNRYGDWTASKSSDPPDGTEVAPGDTIEYEVIASQILTGGESDGVVVTEDLAGVLDDATLVAGSISASAGTAVVVGTSIVWTLDGLTSREVLRFRVTVDPGAWNATLDNVLLRNGGVACETVAAQLDPSDADCDETHHPTAAPPDLPATGSALSPLVPVIGLLMVLVGVAVVASVALIRRTRRG